MITVAEAKQHLRVMHDLEDSLIQIYLDAAQAHIADYLGDDLPDHMPAPIHAAVLLLTGDLYLFRERQAGQYLFESTAFTLLLAPYRTMDVL